MVASARIVPPPIARQGTASVRGRPQRCKFCDKFRALGGGNLSVGFLTRFEWLFWAGSEFALKEPAANTLTDALRSVRVRPDSWLVGAFLVLLGVAVSAALPQISGAVRSVVADAAKSGTVERAQRPVVRLQFIGVRLVQPKAPAGHDFVPSVVPLVAVAAVDDRISARLTDLAARVQERGFRARAPPHHG